MHILIYFYLRTKTTNPSFTILKAVHKYICIYLYSIIAIVKLKTKNLS